MSLTQADIDEVTGMMRRAHSGADVDEVMSRALVTYVEKGRTLDIHNPGGFLMQCAKLSLLVEYDGKHKATAKRQRLACDRVISELMTEYLVVNRGTGELAPNVQVGDVGYRRALPQRPNQAKAKRLKRLRDPVFAQAERDRAKRWREKLKAEIAQAHEK